jgi:hypothetical protein
VNLAPRELPQGGVHQEMLTVLFEEILRLDVITAPLHHICRLDELTDADLNALLRDACRLSR